ncbi:MAG: SLBB domain-containing protein [Bacteroidota bacterium]|nr:SLBB domain-containing protein [Bacteroidota bacterium]
MRPLDSHPSSHIESHLMPGIMRKAPALLGIAGVVVFSAATALGQIVPGTGGGTREKSTERTTITDIADHVVELPVSDANYIVGPTDLLNLTILAERSYSFDVMVGSDGRIVIPTLGDVHVTGRTLAEVRRLVGAVVQRTFRDADFTVSLIRARRIKVSVTGAVREPGVITMPATARVTEALAYAGGIVRDTTALRGITVRRGDSVFTADLLSFYRNGDLSRNPFLMGGDVVHFPRIDRRVGVFGAVNYEGHIDWMPGERLYEYIRLAGGFRSSVYPDSVLIVRFLPDNKTTVNIYVNLQGYPEDPSGDVPMEPGDLVLVKGYSKYRHHRLVLLKGEVKFPGSYSIEPGVTRLSDVIRRAGGFTAEAALEDATVIRPPDESERDKEFERLAKINPADMREDEYEYFKDRSRERVGQLVVDFHRLFVEGDRREDIVLQDKDIVEIPSQKNYIRVIGRVNNPGNVIYRQGWSYRQYIDACQGYGWRADDGDVRIIKSRTGEFVDASDESRYDLEPGDTIWVPEVPKRKFWDIALTTLSVLGQVAGIVGIVIALSRL